MKRLQSQPFALIGINSDGDAETVKKILADQKITWRQAIDGSTSGPLATKWNIKGWPTIFVLDAKGVIRAKTWDAKAMDDAIDMLLAEMGAPKK